MPAAVPQMMKLQVNNFMFTVACDDDDGGGRGRGRGGGCYTFAAISRLTMFHFVQKSYHNFNKHKLIVHIELEVLL